VRRVNAFDWTAEFADAMAAGGFDAVIGNPPYIRIQALQEWAPLEVEHYKAAYRAASKGNYDIYVVFVEKGLQLLNARGRLGFILPNKFLTTDYGRPIRKLISSGRSLHALVDFGHNQVFEQATTYTCLLFLARQPNYSFMFARADASSSSLTSLALSRWLAADTLTQDSWVFKQEAATGLYEKMAGRSVPLL